MIEINLLPPHYRTVERTPLPVFLGVIGGIVLLAGLGGVYAMFAATGRSLEDTKQARLLEKEKKQKEVDSIRKLEKEIADAQGRIDTVLGIAESKIYWAQKLDELNRVLPNYAWIESLNFDGAKLVLQCKARGTSLQRYTELRARFRNNVNFMYHFDSIPFSAIDVVSPGAEFLERAVLSFTLTLPIRQVEQAPAQPAKK